MEQILNYLDIPEEKRDGVLEALFHLNFYAPEGKKELKRKMDASCRESLPQYRFVFRDDTLIGYSFLYGPEEANVIGGSGVSNVDQLPHALAVQVLEEEIALWETFHCHQLAQGTSMLLENQKKGIGRRLEKDCR